MTDEQAARAARMAADRLANDGKPFVLIPYADSQDADRRRELRELGDGTGRTLVNEVVDHYRQAVDAWAARSDVRRIRRSDTRDVLASLSDIAAGRAIVVSDGGTDAG